MGLSIYSGPDFENDSHGYVCKDTTELDILYFGRCPSLEEIDFMFLNPEIDRGRYSDECD